LPGYTEAERNHVVCGVDYASLMLVDVVAIPPSGSPFFKFVQGNPGLLDQLPGYVHRAIVPAYISSASSGGLRDADGWRAVQRARACGFCKKCRYVSKPGLDWDVVGGRLYSHAVLRIEREIV
jgi:hypothetical protein